MPNKFYSQQGIDFINQYFNQNKKICADTRSLRLGDIFIAYSIDSPNDNQVNKVCNFEHIQQAIKLKPSAVLADEKLMHDENYAEYKNNLVENNIPILVLPNLYEYIGDIVSYFNGYPSSKLPVIGVTGTNGKTSVSTWLAQCLNALNSPACVIGTLGTGFLDNLQHTGFTTPDAINLHYQLNEYAVKAGAKAVCIEVSSHGLKQCRVDGVKFHTAIFTNLTQDHLDYHGSSEDYINSKHLLFQKKNLEYAVINTDDEIGRKFIQNTTAKNIISYSMNKQNIFSNNSLYLKEYTFIAHKKQNGYKIQLEIKWKDEYILVNLIVGVLGEFNLYNLMAVIGGLLSLNYSWQQIKEVLPNIKSVAGRLEIVKTDYSSKLVIVDYAHTPDALEKTLHALQPIAKQRKGNLWCIFGCGGNRDKTKRPLMGKIVQDNSDIVIITNDNPRFEEPTEIIKNILIGIDMDNIINHSVKVIEDRYDAINYAVQFIQEQDVLLIAGKGHETYQEIKGIKHNFNDVLIAKEFLG